MLYNMCWLMYIMDNIMVIVMHMVNWMVNSIIMYRMVNNIMRMVG